MADEKTVVYIEDETAMIEMVKLILGRKGLNVIGATSGSEGLQAIRAHKPDLILLDLMLPGLDGWEVYQLVKADESLKSIPVVVVTAKAQPIDKAVGLNVAHANGYITKPFSPQELIEGVEKCLGPLS